MKTKTITLTVEQWHLIMDAASIYADTGPFYEGWQSDGLVDATNALESALDHADESESD